MLYSITSHNNGKLGQVTVDGKSLDFTYQLSSRRSYQITVTRDGLIKARAPLRTSYKKIQTIVAERAAWINKKRAFFSKYKTTPVRYMDGAVHPYLGKNYPLRIHPAPTCMISVDGDDLRIESPYYSEEDISSIMELWYKRRAEEIFSSILDNCWGMFCDWGYDKPFFTVRKMRTRWGSMSSKGRMSLNLELIKASLECIEYVIIHELCHLKHHNHGAGFYAALEKRLPHWKKLKHTLEESHLKHRCQL